MMNPTQALEYQREMLEFTRSPLGRNYLRAFIENLTDSPTGMAGIKMSVLADAITELELREKYGIDLQTASLEEIDAVYERVTAECTELTREIESLTERIDLLYEEMVEGQIGTLTQAQPYAVADDMLDLVLHAARTLPQDTVLQHEDIPCPNGFVLLPRDITLTPDQPHLIRALAWTITGDHVMVFWYGTTDQASHELSIHIPVRISLVYGIPLPLGRTPDWISATHHNGDIYASRPVLEFIMAFWHLTQQTVTAKETHRVERHAAKRFTRVTARKDPTVVIVCLRRTSHPDSTSYPNSNPLDPDSPAAREWHSRWLVRGHWRQQPYGPGRAFKRPIWIAPFVKGPDDAPLKLHQTVNYLVQ